MAIDGIYNNLGSMMVVHRTTGQDADAGRTASGSEQAQTADGGLARLTDSASLSALSPRLRSTLEDISERGGNVLETLEQNVADLQEGFLDTLSARLDEAGVSLDEKLTLSMDDEGALSVLGDHPDKARIQQTLSGAPELSSAFGELASQSEIIRDIRNLRRVVTARVGAAAYDAVDAVTADGASEGAASAYRVSLKGAMSHFYFGRNA
ncbi:hypothetical protein [Nitratidesulfovibrio sp. 1201_IL3209]|uniref:hypothetical protein n=1 Tax=Nitratidesulfovibrio sp. 1201_IL3209 TaxID=3084053 RepID=UPI002FDB44FB